MKNDGDFRRHRLGERIPSHHWHRAVQAAQSLVKFGHFGLGLLNAKKTDNGERSYFVPFFYCFTLEIDVLLKVWKWPRGTLCLICSDGQQSVGKRSIAHREQPLSTFLLALAVSSCREEAVAIPKCDSWKQKKKRKKIGPCVHKHNSCNMLSTFPQLWIYRLEFWNLAKEEACFFFSLTKLLHS